MEPYQIQEAAFRTNLGLVEPGKCETCGAYGGRFKFYNDQTNEEEAVEYDLCPSCIRKAVRSVWIYLTEKERIAGRRVSQ